MPEASSTRLEPITKAAIRSELLRGGLDWWCQSDGVVDQQDPLLDRLFPAMHICAENETIWPPPIICIGPNSDFAKFAGREVISEVIRNGDVSDRTYSLEVSQTYLQVRECRQPSIERVTSQLSMIGFDPVWLCYERLIVPGTLKSGRELYLVFNKIERVLRDTGCSRGGQVLSKAA